MFKILWWVAWTVVWWHVLPAWLFWLAIGYSFCVKVEMLNRAC